MATLPLTWGGGRPDAVASYPPVVQVGRTSTDEIWLATRSEGWLEVPLRGVALPPVPGWD